MKWRWKAEEVMWIQWFLEGVGLIPFSWREGMGTKGYGDSFMVSRRAIPKAVEKGCFVCQ